MVLGCAGRRGAVREAVEPNRARARAPSAGFHARGLAIGARGAEDGALQVPAGTYWAAGAVTIDVYPYERRDWAQVVVQAEEEPESETLRVSRLSHPRFEGEGSAPVLLTEQEFSLLAGGGSGSGVRLNGFGR